MALEPDKIASLSDGRTVGYSECGDPVGQPVLVFPDVFESRLQLMARESDLAAAGAGVRLLTVERPGIGLSDPRPGRAMLDWPVDVVGFAEEVGLTRFSVLGWGGGGGYALACALRIPHRLRSVGVVAGWPPPDHPDSRTAMTAEQRRTSLWAQYFPWLLERRARQIARQAVIGSDRLIERERSALAAIDQRHLDDPVMRSHGLTSLRAAFRRGERGPLDDLLLVSRRWGFALSEIPMVVNVWFGGADRRSPPAASHLLSAAVARSEAREFPDDGHFGLQWRRMDSILGGLLATAEREAGRPVG